MNNQPKITVSSVLSEGTSLGIKNVPSLIGACLLWILTFWIPYINVGTTIAMYSIPVELSKGHVISPLFIFDGKYRQYMGEFFALIGLMMISIIPAMMFFVIPAYIISIGWCLAVYLLLDKGLSPSEALVASNKATYGYKWTIFFVNLIIGLVVLILSLLFTQMGNIGYLLYFVTILLSYPISVGCTSIIYRDLTKEEVVEEIIVDKIDVI